MKNLRFLCQFIVLCCAVLGITRADAQLAVVGDGGPGPVKAQHLTAELVTQGGAIAPGGTLQAGLVLTLEEHWHVYWINAGDSGQPPKMEWTLPKGITAGQMLFPAPSRLPLGPLMDFGYEDSVAFPVLLKAAKDAKLGPAHLDAKVSWLVCREVCIPGKAHLGLNVAVANGAQPATAPVGALGQALTQIPEPLPDGMSVQIAGGKKDFVLTLHTGDRETSAEFYPLDEDLIVNSAEQVVEPMADGVRVMVQRSPDLKQLPATLHGVIKLGDSEAYEVQGPVVPGEIAAAPGAHVVGRAKADTNAVSSTLGAVALAFVGGIILNLMPCVFPVLFLKGLSLVQSSGEERRRQRSHGLVYTLGILVSFWTILGILLVVRAGGSEVGWGFQLQSPVFIAVLASGLFFFALSLAGQFELGLSLTSAGGELAQKQGYTGSFFTGVLATVVATPCTAPLMGAAIGFALAQPALVTFGVFTALALGLAFPYLLLTAQPAWTRWLPKPGAWMEVLKQLTAVPLFATVIWLAWVFGRLYSGNGGEGIDHVARLLVCFLLLAIAGWALGRWPAKWGSAIAAVVLGALALGVAIFQPKDTTLVWQPYSAQTLEQARTAGHPVFIDFTAAWCLSCQVNERLVLKSAEVQREFAEGKVTLLKADWTQYDPEITKELASVGRSGVPTYVIYPAKAGSRGDVLPELLTKSIVLEALAKDLKQ